MIETCRLKNVVIFIQKILSFVLSRKIDISFSCGNYDNTQSKAFNDINEVYDINFQTGNEIK